MLSIFPLMFLSLVAHALLRLFIGGVFLYLGIRHIGHDRAGLTELMRNRFPYFAGFLPLYIAIVEIVLGAMFILGFATQIAALLAIVFSIKMLVLRKRMTPPIFPQSIVYVLILGISISLAITGAGVFAFDLPV